MVYRSVLRYHGEFQHNFIAQTESDKDGVCLQPRTSLKRDSNKCLQQERWQSLPAAQTPAKKVRHSETSHWVT